MTTRVDEVETTVHSVVFNISTIQTGLVTEKLVILLIDVVYDGLPAATSKTWKQDMDHGRSRTGEITLRCTYHFSLLTASPNPGVSTTVSLSLTPFSSMSTVVASILTVWAMRSRSTCMKQKIKKNRYLIK